MTKKKAALSAVALIMIGVGIGRYILPNNVTKDETTSERTDKEVVRTVEEITRPDGTKEKKTETREVTRKEKDKESHLEVTVSKPNYMVSLMIGKNLNFDTTYAIKVDRRVFANFFAGGYISTNKDIGISLGYEF